jgi:hypothetical protein
MSSFTHFLASHHLTLWGLAVLVVGAVSGIVSFIANVLTTVSLSKAIGDKSPGPVRIVEKREIMSIRNSTPMTAMASGAAGALLGAKFADLLSQHHDVGPSGDPPVEVMHPDLGGASGDVASSLAESHEVVHHAASVSDLFSHLS